MAELISAQNLTGFLFRSSTSEIKRNSLAEWGSIVFTSEFGETGWESYSFLSQEPLAGEDHFNLRGPYSYPLICRRSDTRVIILSSHRRIVEKVVENESKATSKYKLEHIGFQIDGLVKKLTELPDVYSLSFAHGRLTSFGNSLKAISFYGDDLAEASYFSENVNLMTFHTCGLKKIEGGSEIVRLGIDGLISCSAFNLQRLKDILDIITYLRKFHFIQL